jgi:hypothetical protein
MQLRPDLLPVGIQTTGRKNRRGFFGRGEPGLLHDLLLAPRGDSFWLLVFSCSGSLTKHLFHSFYLE